VGIVRFEKETCSPINSNDCLPSSAYFIVNKYFVILSQRNTYKNNLGVSIKWLKNGRIKGGIGKHVKEVTLA